MRQEIYWIQFSKELAAIRKLHEIKVRVAAEHLRRQGRLHSTLSQQLNIRPCHNNKKEIRTQVMKIHD